MRVSPRTTPSKERTRLQRSRERDKDLPNSVSSVLSASSADNAVVTSSEKANSDNKSKFRSRQRKEEKVDSPSRKTDSPRNWADSPRGSPRRRSLSRTPVQTETESVIKSNSGSKRDKRVTEKSDRKVSNCAKSETSENKEDTDKCSKPNVSDDPSTVNATSSNSTSEKGKQKDEKVSKESNDLVEQKVQEIKTALKKKEKEAGSSKPGEGKEKKTPKICSKKETTSKRKDKKSGNESTQEVSCDVKESVDAKKAGCTSDVTIDESGDNMHYIKKKQSILAGGASSGSPQNSVIPPTNIDLNQSLTDQITRVEKLTSVNGDDKPSSVANSQSSSGSDIHRDTESLSSSKDQKAAASSNSGSFQKSNSSSNIVEERSQSRNSDSRCSSAFSGDETKRPASRVDEIKSVKNSPSSSPLIVDKSEPVQIYRDPELMINNPVRSNVPNMHNSHKSYPTVHNPIPTQASRPASVGMPSTPLSSSLERTSRTPVIPAVAYQNPLQMPPSAIPGGSLSGLLPPGLSQLDPATLALHQQMQAVQQHQVAAALAQQYSSALSMSYPPRGTLSKAQIEHIWQQKYPSVPVPPPWLLNQKHHEELVGGVRLLHEQEQLERERLERLEREREREQRDRKERERRDRERMEKERLER